MTKFVHTVKKDNVVTEQPDNVKIEWSLETQFSGDLYILGNGILIQHITSGGHAYSQTSNARKLGLDCQDDGSLLVK